MKSMLGHQDPQNSVIIRLINFISYKHSDLGKNLQEVKIMLENENIYNKSGHFPNGNNFC